MDVGIHNPKVVEVLSFKDNADDPGFTVIKLTDDQGELKLFVDYELSEWFAIATAVIDHLADKRPEFLANLPWWRQHV
jgi:hypothetical protein